MIISPRFHLFEVNDQPWWPQYLREKVQDVLTLLWTFRVPVIQAQSPADLVASTLSRVLGNTTSNYTYVDFASGAGGPTPYIEKRLNEEIRRTNKASTVKFVMTDLHPHPEAWKAAARKSDNLDYVARSVDAANSPRDLLSGIDRSDGKMERKVMRLFHLAFHHFDDELASRILENTVDTADGFAIFELQSRTVSSLITVFLMGPLMFLISPFFFWHSPGHLFFTYFVPLLPFCLVYDGYISSLRTRTPEEVAQLLKNTGKRLDGWKFMSGQEMHTNPTGWMSWIICVKDI